MKTFQQLLAVKTDTEPSDLVVTESIAEKAPGLQQPMLTVAPFSIAPISEEDNTVIINSLKNLVNIVADQISKTDKAAWENVSEVRLGLKLALVPVNIDLSVFPRK